MGWGLASSMGFRPVDLEKKKLSRAVSPQPAIAAQTPISAASRRVFEMRCLLGMVNDPLGPAWPSNSPFGLSESSDD